MGLAKLREDLRGNGIPAYDLDKDKHISLSIGDNDVFKENTWEDLGAFDDYNTIIVYKGDVYFVNSIDLDFVEDSFFKAKEATILKKVEGLDAGEITEIIYKQLGWEIDPGGLHVEELRVEFLGLIQKGKIKLHPPEKLVCEDCPNYTWNW